ncbi:family 10 glycosylhydrolase [Sphingobacterium rhinopitheci]|uniref:family 10 glycosylhydrolase n=1 Tax=Sphingobacterium rhinopitheci TaxID=2781960 RepID=UPI001F515C02|nr:family 10 glycosylhydrolase [Sphingobacterium rhinopitheci]MCI0922221.1 family 10 glycosylhydrolase [Sphingobacterium rhinopitheci]
MASRRHFIKSAGLGLASLQLLPDTPIAPPKKTFTFDYWLWNRPDRNEPEYKIKQKFQTYKDAGVRGIFFEDYSKKHFQLAKEHGIEAHRWMWTMNRGEKELIENHPEYYAVSRSGKSCATHPPYVGYYRFLCPSHPDVPKYLEDRAREQLEKEDVDGLHLDYIRYPDVVLPINLWENYNLDQSTELADYDFCYSKFSKDAFFKETGIDIDKVQRPDQNLSWRAFRYKQITKVVNQICDVAKDYHKPVSAAVFPTPDQARRMVRQDWPNWNLSAVFPMIYHGFYKEPIHWIGTAVDEGVHALQGKYPLYAGLYLPDFKSLDELKEGILIAKKNGAAGISLFGEKEFDPQTISLLKSLK